MSVSKTYVFAKRLSAVVGRLVNGRYARHYIALDRTERTSESYESVARMLSVSCGKIIRLKIFQSRWLIPVYCGCVIVTTAVDDACVISTLH